MKYKTEQINSLLDGMEITDEEMRKTLIHNLHKNGLMGKTYKEELKEALDKADSSDGHDLDIIYKAAGERLKELENVK